MFWPTVGAARWNCRCTGAWTTRLLRCFPSSHRERSCRTSRSWRCGRTNSARSTAGAACSRSPCTPRSWAGRRASRCCVHSSRGCAVSRVCGSRAARRSHRPGRMRECPTGASPLDLDLEIPDARLRIRSARWPRAGRADEGRPGQRGGVDGMRNTPGDSARAWPERADLSTLRGGIGSRLFEDTRYAQDATLVARFEAGGFIAFARTTVPELCMAPTTEALRNGGPARNPWDRGRSAGGSSGGAAAAVAAGIVPIAHGSDGGGSIRIPAACCGLFGLKPSRGVVPMGPLRGEGWGGLAVDGVLSRTVRGTAAAIEAVAGIERGAPYAAPALARSLRSAVGDAPRRLRIGVWRAAFAGIDIAPECVEAVDATAGLCRALGHEVID